MVGIRFAAERSATLQRIERCSLEPQNGSQCWLPFCYNDRSEMRNAVARQIGEELKTLLERLKVLAKQERTARGPDAEAIEIAVVNLDSAIEILTE